MNLAWTTNPNQEGLISRKYWGKRRLAIVSVYLVLIKNLLIEKNRLLNIFNPDTYATVKIHIFML